MCTLKGNVAEEQTSNKACNIHQLLLTKLGLTTATKYCAIHKTTYDCIVDTKTDTDSGCPLCNEKLPKQKPSPSIDGLPKRYKNVTFNSYVVSNKNQNDVKGKVVSFAREPHDKWLFMLGKNGTGKTHLAFASLKITGGIYREYDDITQELLDAQNKGQGDINKIL